MTVPHWIGLFKKKGFANDVTAHIVALFTGRSWVSTSCVHVEEKQWNLSLKSSGRGFYKKMRRDAREASILWRKHKKIIIFYQICPWVTSCFYLTLSISLWRRSILSNPRPYTHRRENITTVAMQTQSILCLITSRSDYVVANGLAGWKRADSP